MMISGKIKVLNEIQIIGTSGFKKRELVILTNEQFPQTLLIEFVQDKCDLLNDHQVGQEVSVSINLRGKEWTNPKGEIKYINTIQGWKIEKHFITPQVLPQTQSEDEEDDFPF